LLFARVQITGQQERLGRIPEDLACAGEHAEARVVVIRLANAAITLERCAHSGVRPAAEPATGRLTVSERELVDESVHLVGKHCNTFRVAEPHLEQCAVPDRGERRHRPSTIAGSRICALHGSARIFDQAKVKERDGEHPEQTDLRIHEEFTRANIEPLHQGESTLEPCSGSTRST
jgi:hypothetical protein